MGRMGSAVLKYSAGPYWAALGPHWFVVLYFVCTGFQLLGITSFGALRRSSIFNLFGMYIKLLPMLFILFNG